MARSTWKGPFSRVPCVSNKNKFITPQPDKYTTREKKQLWSRTSMILPDHIGKEFFVHNGKKWVSLKILQEMTGHKFGEFSSTRKKQANSLGLKRLREKKNVLKGNTSKQSTRKK